jgi:glycosyltransferase involved in cell wall biosynthesis
MVGGYSFLKMLQDELSNKSDIEFVLIIDRPQRVDVSALKYLPLYTSIVDYIFFRIKRVICRIMKISYNQERKLRKKFTKEKIDIVWITGPFEMDVPVPYIFTVWDIGHRVIPCFPEVSSNGQWESRERVYRKMLFKATYIITGNETGKKEILENYPMNPQKIKMVPFPNPMNYMTESSSDYKLSIPIKEPYIFYPAQFWPHKNHVTLIDAVKYMHDNDCNIHCYFSGSDQGNMSYIKEKIRKYDLEKYIHVLGFIDTESLICLYKNALALTFVSLLGPNNLPPLEAISLGCPVIISNIPGHIEQMEDAAILVDATDHIQIANAVIKLLSDNYFRSELIEKGKKLAEKQRQYSYLDEIVSILSDFKKMRRLWL